MLTAVRVAKTFVRLISTVGRAVADSNARDARRLVGRSTLELAGLASERWAALFVRAIETVLVSVARPKDRNTAVIGRATSMLAARAIRHTRVVILQHRKVVRAGTSIAFGSIRRQQAEMSAVAIVLATGIIVGQLSQWMIHVHIVRPVRSIAQHLEVFARKLVRPHQSLRVPIGPEEPVVEHRQRKDMRHASTTEHCASVASIEVGVVDVIEMSVGPIELVTKVIDRQRIRPHQLRLVRDDARKVAAVHAHPPNEGVMAPVGEEDQTQARVQHNGSRVGDATGQQCLAMGSIQLGHLDVFRGPIQPVQLVRHPVDGNTFEAMCLVSDQILLAGAVDEDSIDGLVAHVGVVDPLVAIVKVQCHHILQVHLHQIVARAIDRSIAQVVSIAEDQPRRNIVAAFAHIAPDGALVILLVALAKVRTWRVETIIAAHRLLGVALVDIFARLPILRQLISLATFAVIAGGRVHALVLALIHLGLEAFVDIAMCGLVAAILTIQSLVARERCIDALATFAAEVSRAAGVCRIRFALWQLFVAHVAAVVLAIAQISLADALRVATRKLFGQTIAEGAISMLVRAIATVVVVI